ncbi:MAG TPA: pilus assembly protein PilC [Comamonadaceae bacterium]|uniref:pilus assembly protein n=1 Tax=Pulveribacter sp. TaxID=2678893 RepID=UPI000EC88509|nr:PilC/PilY family type IV pilus protein [Pulveribacter sp.]HCL86318.1 pilus assembly protein PilC [Comamonadaceae bacterium]
MPSSSPLRFPQTLIALAAVAALTPQKVWAALDFAQAPPGTVEPYVAPNVIISIDDSGSMNYRLDRENATGANNDTSPNGPSPNTWLLNSRRMNVLKYALKEVFNDTNLLPDGKIRLAWQAMNANNNTPGNVNSGGTAQFNTNSMQVLDQAHRTNFISFVNRLTPNSSTPSHKMFKQADEYMRLPLHQNGPWAAKPGTTGSPYLGCRRNYHIFMTDGRWNGTVSGGSQDNNTAGTRFPDSTLYSGPNTRLYHDTYSDTLADWAFKSWSDSLKTSGLTGSVKPLPEYNQAPATEMIGGTALPKYWNPKYNPATWPHMVTYTIGFSQMAYTWPGASSIIRPTEMVPFGYDGSFPDLVNGTKTWPAMSSEDRRSLDLWHAALNGRGRFYAVEKGEDLEDAFRQIIKTIGTDVEPDRGSTATSGSNATRNNVGRFTASYEPDKHWKGMITGEIVKSDNTTAPHPGWGNESTADKLDGTPFGSRIVLSWSDQKDALGKEKGGVAFRWATNQTYLSTAQKTYLNAGNLGSDRLNYVRGDTSKQRTSATSTLPFRQRTSVQGDIVNSEVWYTGTPASNYALKNYSTFTQSNKDRLAMIYVGGNDGMLHGFSADNGSEKLAYVPRGVIPKLARLTDPVFNDQHRHYVDGSPMTGDVDIGGGPLDPKDPSYPTYNPIWRTMLIGTLGAGGKGYFVLDVTNPNNFTESNASSLVVMDRTRDIDEVAADCSALNGSVKTTCDKQNEEDADIGHIFAKPVVDPENSQRTTQIVRMNNNRWAVVMGNGYNSVNQRPVLLIQYLDQGKELVRLIATGSTPPGTTGNTTDNGLSAPRLVDINNDGRPDTVYAGDNKGNLWKFLIASNNDSEWGVAQWGSNANTTANSTINGTPLYTAKGGTEGSPNSRTLSQPIVTAPTVRANDRMKTITVAGVPQTVPVGGMMVAFGTGRNVAKTDPENAGMGIHTLYSVLDNTVYKLVGTEKDRVAVCANTGDSDCQGLLDRYGLPSAVSVTASGPGNLVQRSISSSAVHSRDNRDFWTVDAASGIDWNTHKGWYMDLPQTGERLLKPMEFYDASNILTVFTQVPARGSRTASTTESCEAGTPENERQYLTMINIMDGKRPSVQLMDTNGDGKYDLSADRGASRMSVTKGAQTLIKFHNKATLYGKDAGGERKDDIALMPETALRPSWRQLQ